MHHGAFKFIIQNKINLAAAVALALALAAAVALALVAFAAVVQCILDIFDAVHLFLSVCCIV